MRLNQDNRQKYESMMRDSLQETDSQQFREFFLELHVSDQADFFMKLEGDFRKLVYSYLTPEEFAEFFHRLEPEEQEMASQEMENEYLYSVVNNLYADDAADFLADLKGSKAIEILTGMDDKEADDVKELMSYEPETAGAIMTKEFIKVSSAEKASQVVERLRREGPDAETVYYLYVVDEEHKLVGVVSLRDLIIADPDEIIKNIMSSRVVSVMTNTDQEEVAGLIRKYDFLAAPVVTHGGILAGIVTVDDILDVIEEEATEDFGEISASKGATDVNISAFTAAKRRSPWIIMLMFFGMITAGVIGQFEETLEQIVLLSIFIPLIMDSAGNTGTQSLAVMVRALATGSFAKKGLWHTIRREFGTGIMLGLICAVTLLLIIPFLYESYLLAFIVGVSLLITLSLATIVGAVIPVIINKLNLDPAIASGPFITTINDILGLLIYFSIATALLQYL
ncbi:magnesium transporter [Evansella sp. LMS18]|uniref:magnesium transporter n=1 Tax=Evansella sp. LMS18 TaxID=2924033 RepID=UPI0034E97D3C